MTPPNPKKKFVHFADDHIVKNGANGIHNGSSFPLITHRYQTKYKTFDNAHVDKNSDVDMNDYTVRWYDVLIAMLVMLMGILATIVATYTSWSDAISSAEFSQPCLLNATAAARTFIEAANHVL